MKKSDYKTLKFNPKALKELFIAALTVEQLKKYIAEQKDGQVPLPSVIVKSLSHHYSSKTAERYTSQAKALIDEYLQWADVEELNWFLDKEKDILKDVLKETEKIGAGFNVEDLVERINKRFNDEGIINASFKVKKQDD